MTNFLGKHVRQGIVGQFFLAIMAFAVFGVSQCLAAAMGSLEASLAVYKPSHCAADALIVEFSLTNHDSEPVQVLPWNTPLEGRFTAPIFKVEANNGQVIEYIGPMLKRRAPTADDYLTLEPGEVVRATLDLAAGYAIYDAGSYSIGFKANLAILGGPRRAKVYGVDPAPSVSAETTLVLSQDRLVSLSPMDKEAAFVGCTADQQDTIDNAFTSAQQIANEATSALGNTPTNQRSTALRYVQWFGIYTELRYATVESNFNAISNTLSQKDISFNCSRCYYELSDPDRTLAYIYLHRPYEVNLCGLFWSAPRLGIDSQAGTIVHEISHFRDVVGTDDYAYGQDGAIALASRYPTLAIDNADNYMYFAENTPPLSMDTGSGSSTGDSGSTNGGNSTGSGNRSRCSNSAKLWIHKAYIGYYARCGEFGGFEYWCTRLDAEGGDLSAIIAAFGTSREYTNRFNGLSDSELINNLYRNMFDRDATDRIGLQFYLDLLASRRQEWRDNHGGSNQGATEYALSRIALDVLTGAQGNDAIILDGKISACPQYWSC